MYIYVQNDVFSSVSGRMLSSLEHQEVVHVKGECVFVGNKLQGMWIYQNDLYLWPH